MTKKIVIIVVISIILLSSILFFYKFYKIIKQFKPSEIDYNNSLNYNSYRVKDKLLNKLKYKIKKQYIIYEKEKYNLIITEDYVENIDKWKDWLKDGKRLIFFVKRDTFNIDIKKIKVKSNNEFFDSVNYLTINSNSDLNIKSKNIKILLKDNGKIHIGEENINNGKIIYISDKIIFSDKLLFESDNAKFLNNLLKEYFNETIVFDYVMSEKKEDKKESFFNSSDFRFFLLHIIGFIIILFLVNIKRFGNPIDLDIYKNRSIDRHIEAVSNFLYNTKNKNVIIKILDQFFFYRLKKIFRCNNDEDLLKIIREKIGIDNKQKILFELGNISDIYDITIKREEFLRNIKNKS